MIRGIDAHIHLDMYEANEILRMMETLPSEQIVGLIAVSRYLDSCIATHKLRITYPKLIHAAFGFHPEQPIPHPTEIDKLTQWMLEHSDDMIAIGEVGLPYYSRLEAESNGLRFDMLPYIELLERFMLVSKQLNKPIILHAVYEDADLACDLLDKHGITKAHFHWFKGSGQTVERMIQAGYFISVTPDVLYEADIQALVQAYPIELIMAETDGPWPFEGPFAEQQTTPGMILEVIRQIARIKMLSVEETAERLLSNTIQFYQLPI